MSKKANTKKWIHEHTADHYVTQANKLGYRSRASFKIIEIQDKFKIFKPNNLVIDLGSAPGGWSEIAVKYIKPKGKIIAVDLLDMQPIKDVDFIKGDFSSDETYEELNDKINNQKLDVVISDIAPNLSGNKTTDQAKSVCLLELVLDFSISNLKKDGSMVAKVFQGEGSDTFVKQVRERFTKVTIFKPKSSRPKSREFYIVAQGFKL